MKKTVILVAVCCSLPSLVLGRGGGDAFAGGLAGGMFGGVIGGAMTKESSDHQSAHISVSVAREFDKLENAVRYDLVKLDERIRTLERSGGHEGGDTEELQKEIRSVKKSVKNVESNLESKIEALDDRIAAMGKKVKNIENKVKKIEGRDIVEPIKTAPAKLEKLEKHKASAPVEVPIDTAPTKE